ncbi:MAG: cytochrome c oxidase assembly protein [Cephaloticoccus sp.]|nr:cytochrome c oxidase assembly protein [Cephaloticoccus sp.]MCF7759164.1 cytochrome c oxidase assembly protein [Cephaloticoccus sp.]
MINWTHWHNEPYLVGGLIFFGWLYALMSGPLRARFAPDKPHPTRQAVKFYAGILVFYLAVGSPLDQISERFLFSAHMVQHFLLMYAAPVLILLGLPGWMVDSVLRHPALSTAGRIASQPVVCGVVFVVTSSVWHAPLLYEWALHDKVVHVIEHIMFFGAALFYWWSQLSPSAVFPARSYPTQMLFQLCVIIAMTPVYAYITFTTEILYPTYEYAPRIIAGFTATEDQLLAGVIMKIGGMLVALAAIGVSFYRWYQRGDDRHVITPG